MRDVLYYEWRCVNNVDNYVCTELQQELSELVIRAIAHFNENEQYLVSHDLSERCICAKFGWYLEKEVSESPFSDYHVDVEYNRGNRGNEYDCKRIDDNRRIVVDLIVHKRGYKEPTGFNNLICIEMKKEYLKPDLESDLERLRIMTCVGSGFSYQAGFMILAFADKKRQDFGLKIEKSFFPQ